MRESGDKARKQQKTNSKPLVSQYYKVLLIVIAILVVCIFIGTFIFWGYIEAYEISLPEHVTSEFVGNINFEYWESLIANEITPLLTEFERGSVPHLFEPIFTQIRNAKFIIRQNTEKSTDEMLVYTLRAGTRDIGNVYLNPSGNAGYGFTIWEVGDIILHEAFIESLARSISITATQGSQVMINGVPVSDEYLVLCEDEYGSAYNIDNIFGDITVTVIQPDGQTAEPYFADEYNFMFPILEPFARSLSILAPEGVDIYINGEVVSQESITERQVVPRILEEFVNVELFAYGLNRFEAEIDGLYSEPEVIAIDSMGRELICVDTDDGHTKINVVPSVEELNTFISTAESFTQAYINYGRNIGGSAQTNFNNLSIYILGDSELYDRLSNSMSGYYYVEENTITYNSLNIENVVLYGDEYIVCSVIYDITVNIQYNYSDASGETAFNEIKEFEVLFIKSGGNWLAAKIVEV